jgi:uncharacterized protein YprB with RNaseH-like and TPR domain
MDARIKELLSRLAQKGGWEDPLKQAEAPRATVLLADCLQNEAWELEQGGHLIIRERSTCRCLPEPIHLNPLGMTEPASAQLDDWIFLDIESTGGSSDPLFLVGLLFPHTQGYAIELHLARHYEEEPSVLTATIGRMTGRRIIATFNGKSYDVPVLRDRSLLHGLRDFPTLNHLDLLHLSRRVYPRGTISNHKLKTLEREVLDFAREGDVDSSDIPRIYHGFIRHGDARELMLVIKHNIMDLQAMYDLLLRILDEKQAR